MNLLLSCPLTPACLITGTMTTEGERVVQEMLSTAGVQSTNAHMCSSLAAGPQRQLLAQTTALLQPVPDCLQDTPY